MNIDIRNTKRLRPKQLSFESEKLKIDYITLNISIKGPIDPEPIARLLCFYGFNSKVKENENAESKNFLSNKKNNHKVTLVKSKYNTKEGIFWNGLAARFPSSNGRFFYDLLKQNKIKFELFPEQDIRLGRFDLCYSYDFLVPEFSRRSNIKIFLNDCKKKYLQKYPLEKVKISDTKTGLILRASDRLGSAKFFRIYEKLKSLRFELEMKRKLIEPYQNSLFSYSFEEFEDELVQVFYDKFSHLCLLDSNYSCWLLKSLRKKLSIKKLEDLNLGISKTIISPYNLEFAKDKETSFNCLQLLSFIQSQNVNMDLSFVESLNLAIVEFALVDFIKFIGKNERSTYQRNKVGKFLNNLLSLEPLRIKVTNVKFQNFHFCSFMELEKRKGTWFVQLRVAVNALSFIYPYTLPNILLTYNKRSELEIKAQFIESLNTKIFLKEFKIDKTYKDISLSNSAIKNRQTTIIKIFKDLKTEKIINNSIDIYFKDTLKERVSIEIKDLTTQLLGKINKICFTEKLN